MNQTDHDDGSQVSISGDNYRTDYCQSDISRNVFTFSKPYRPKSWQIRGNPIEGELSTQINSIILHSRGSLEERLLLIIVISANGSRLNAAFMIVCSDEGERFRGSGAGVSELTEL